MKPRRLAVTPQAQRDLAAVVAWYQRELGAAAAAKAARNIQAGVRAATRIELSRARREDLPDGYFRVVAKAHLVIFTVENDTAKIVRILHGARDIASAARLQKGLNRCSPTPCSTRQSAAARWPGASGESLACNCRNAARTPRASA